MNKHNKWSDILNITAICYMIITVIVSAIAGITMAVAEETSVFLLISVGGCLAAFVGGIFLLTIAEIGKNVAAIRANTEKSVMMEEMKPSASGVHKVKVIKAFKDAKAGVYRSEGSIFEGSEERFNEITAAGDYIEEINKIY